VNGVTPAFEQVLLAALLRVMVQDCTVLKPTPIVAAPADSIFDWREVGAQVTRHRGQNTAWSPRSGAAAPSTSFL
jgi:hypothetical protein